MPSWILGPINHRAEIWNVYAVQRVVVEAPCERQARGQVAAAAPDAASPNPWLDPNLTTCEEITPPDLLAPPRWVYNNSAGDRAQTR
jgi:hypothetical protein